MLLTFEKLIGYESMDVDGVYETRHLKVMVMVMITYKPSNLGAGTLFSEKKTLMMEG